MPKLEVGMCPAMTTQVLKQLQSQGIADVLDFISTDPEKITSSCGISYKKIMLIRRVLLAQYSAFPNNGLALYKELLNACAVLSSGCSDLDNILDGGIYTGEITEVVGISVSGKTQFCQTLAVNVAAVFQKNIVCIDTNVGWSVKRISEILVSRHPKMNSQSSLSRIKISRCLSMEELDVVLTQIRDALQNQHDVFFSSMKLLIIDSVASILSPSFFNGTYIEGLSMLQEFGRRLNALAKDFNIALVIINNMVSCNNSASSDAFTVKPALGKCWTFVPSIRLVFQPETEPCLFESNETGQNISVRVTLDKSTRSGKRTTAFRITQSGLANL